MLFRSFASAAYTRSVPPPQGHDETLAWLYIQAGGGGSDGGGVAGVRAIEALRLARDRAEAVPRQYFCILRRRPTAALVESSSDWSTELDPEWAPVGAIWQEPVQDYGGVGGQAVLDGSGVGLKHASGSGSGSGRQTGLWWFAVLAAIARWAMASAGWSAA